MILYIVLIFIISIFLCIIYFLSRKIKIMSDLKKTFDTLSAEKDLIELFDKFTDEFAVIINKKLNILNCNSVFAKLLNKKKKSILKKSIINEIYKIVHDNTGELKYLIIGFIEAAFQGVYGNIDLPIKNKANKIIPYAFMIYPVSEDTVFITGKVTKPNVLVYSSLKNEKYSFTLDTKTEYLNLFADKLVSSLYGKISLSDIALMKSALNILICEFFDNLSGKKSAKKLTINYVYEPKKITYTISAIARNFNWNIKLNEDTGVFQNAVFSLTFTIIMKSFNKVNISSNGKKLTLVKHIE